MEKTILSFKQKLDVLLERYFSGDDISYKYLIAVIIPILVDQSFLILMSLLNTAMISSAGVASVSAVSMVDSLNIFLINVFIAVATGGTVIVAQYKGSGNKERVSKTATQALSAVTLMSLVISVGIIIFHLPLLHFLFGQSDAAIFQNAKVYLIGSCISYPFIAVFEAVCGALRGVGETKPCLGLSLLLNLTNTFLNVIFISFLHMGVMGLVISIILARCLGMAASIFYIVKLNETIHIKNIWHFDAAILKKIMYIGLPFAAEQLFFNGGKLLTQTFIVQLGALAMAVYAIGNSIAALFQIGPNALSIATVTIVGQCMGKRNIQDAKKFAVSLIGLSSIVFVFADCVLMPCFPIIIKLFHPPHEIVPTIFTLIVISSITQPLFWSISFIMPSALRAAGDSKFTSVASLMSMWLVRVILGYILGITFGWGIIGVWSAMTFEWGIRGLVFVFRFKGSKWYAHRLVE